MAWAWAVRNWRQVGPDRRGAGSIPASREDLPHRGDGDAVAESDQFALYAPVSPARILGRQAEDELLDRCGGGRTSRSAVCGVVPFPCNELAVPDQDRGGRDREDLGPAAMRQQPGQAGQPHPVGRRVAHPGDLSAQHGVLVAQDQQFGILAQIPPHQHRSQTEQGTHQPVQDRQQQHPTIIHDREPHERPRSAPASSYRAPHRCCPRLVDCIGSSPPPR